MVNQTDRRSFLRTSLLGGAALLGGPTLLAACGGDDDDAAAATSPTSGAGTTTAGTTTAGTMAGTGEFGALDYQLSWIKNAEFAGQYIADSQGFYTEAGFSSVNFLAGGPGVQQEQVVASGKALIGISSPDITSPAILQGAPLIALGALFQKNPFCFMSLAEAPISTAKELEGKKVGIQDVNQPVWNAFAAAAGLDVSKIDVVPVQFDPQGLVNKEVDAWFSFVTNEPNALRAQGVDVEVFLLADQGYPLVSQIYFTQISTLADQRDLLKALLIADIKGWRESIKDPEIGAELAVDVYGKDLGLTLEAAIEESKSQNELIVTDDTKANGILTISDELMAATIESLGFGGTEISAEQLFDLSLLEEIYSENPDLKADPTV